jgi:hypothetical protein
MRGALAARPPRTLVARTLEFYAEAIAGAPDHMTDAPDRFDAADQQGKIIWNVACFEEFELRAAVRNVDREAVPLHCIGTDHFDRIGEGAPRVLSAARTCVLIRTIRHGSTFGK